MEGPRAPKVTEFSELVKFLDQNLRQQPGWSVADEYPTALNVNNLQNLRIIKEQDKILSHALVKTQIVKTRRGLFKVGCIGSVVTHDTSRNQGLSSQVIQECLKNVTAQGCEFAVLWTNLYDFYRKLGFELAGTEVSIVIEKPLAINSAKYRIVEGNKVDAAALFRVYSQHSVHSVRTLEDFEKYLKVPNSRIYTAWGADGKLEGYAVEGKGADLQGYIHEWGGSTEAVVALANHTFVKRHQPTTLITPNHAQGLIRAMESLGCRRVDGFLGMIKMTHPQSLFNKILRSARQEWGIENLTFEFRDGHYYYGTPDNLYKTDQEADIVKLLFGPALPSQMVDHGAELNQVLDKILPLEMWIWGWDSV